MQLSSKISNIKIILRIKNNCKKKINQHNFWWFCISSRVLYFNKSLFLSWDILYLCSYIHLFSTLKRKQTLPYLWSVDEELPPIHHGNPITDRRSTFQAHLAPVVTPRQVSRDQYYFFCLYFELDKILLRYLGLAKYVSLSVFASSCANIVWVAISFLPSLSDK